MLYIGKCIMCLMKYKNMYNMIWYFDYYFYQLQYKLKFNQKKDYNNFKRSRLKLKLYFLTPTHHYFILTFIVS